MVLGRKLTDADGVAHAMAGLLSVETSFAKRKMNLGYRRAVLEADGPLGPAGGALTGHEFHYASIVAQGDDPPFAMVTDPHGSAPAPAGSRRGARPRRRASAAATPMRSPPTRANGRRSMPA
jgi:cobyrinic acid a,c-diamide synthase